MAQRTSGTPEEAKQRTATTYNAAADVYDDPANSFWERFGSRTVARLQLAPGSNVLDVCCGSGASAIPAAAAVGDNGSVIGVDLAENLLQLARTKAAARDLRNIRFVHDDILSIDLAPEGFDAVICVFGIFFIPDMPSAMRELWRYVKPGGRLAITTWGPRFFEPANTAFWNSIRAVRPDLHKSFNPWERISEPEALRSLFESAGVEDSEVVAENGIHPVGSPDDWWSMILGSGYRGTVEQLDDNDRETVRLENLDFISRNDVRGVEANVLYGIARKLSR
jgi:ubiquinone/menaquinone biosynthesis C-methylase UbiE